MASVDVVIPVYNEERALPRSIDLLHTFLSNHLTQHQWRIIIADNASIDQTLAVAQALANQYPHVGTIHLDLKGRGRALKAAWLGSEADILTYMDVDLSTDLSSFPALVAAIAEEGYDIAIGSRLLGASRVERSLKREIISRGYNFLIKATFFVSLSDAQCGFKAIHRAAAQKLVPQVQDNAWFFDTELLLLALRQGHRVKEIPVTWVEDPDSRVDILRTAWEDIKGLWRLRIGGTR